MLMLIVTYWWQWNFTLQEWNNPRNYISALGLGVDIFQIGSIPTEVLSVIWHFMRLTSAELRFWVAAFSQKNSDTICYIRTNV